MKITHLPWDISASKTLDIFRGHAIRNGTEGINLTYNNRGLPTHMAFTELQKDESLRYSWRRGRYTPEPQGLLKCPKQHIFKCDAL
jgi:hypothetical protein